MINAMQTVRRRHPRLIALALAIFAHALFFTLVAWRLGGTPAIATAPVITVQIIRTPPRAPAFPLRHPSSKANGQSRSAVLVVPSQIAPRYAEPSNAEAPAGSAEEVQHVLRGLLGCAPAVLPHLSPEERRLCEERLASGQVSGGAFARLNLDPTGRYAKDPTPYLNRKPHDGCKVGAAGD
ncbi:MAG TPA: hypothetical protein VFE10_01000, partial [Phenylobacterium sp.]|nr:hypothetical protein [Phenylobacterium sp.]